MNSSTTVCTVCQKHKYQLRIRKSKLNGMAMYLCNECFEKKLEPRWLIIITAQSEGADAVADYLLNHRYAGPEIPAVELVK